MPSTGGENGPNGTEGLECPQVPKKPLALTAGKKDSFAYKTMKDRVPVIICKVIDTLHRQRLQLALKDGDALKRVIELMAKLRYEMQTNKPLTAITDGRPDALVWNEYLDARTAEGGATPRWFDTCWLYSECYVYRRLLECMAESSELRDFDFFSTHKADGFNDNLAAVDALAATLETMLFGKHMDVTNADGLANDFRKLLETSLWGNKCDLSISAGEKQEASTSSGETSRSHLLVDDWNKVWQCLIYARISASTAGGGVAAVGGDELLVDMVLDNSGFELFSDLCLADFLITSGLASRVRLRLKANSWFLSDATETDLDRLLAELSQGARGLRRLRQSGSKKSAAVLDPEERKKATRLESLHSKWKSYIDSGSWSIHSDSFWTYPHDYSLMRSCDRKLYSSLSEASLVVFKGDLNYRKLVGDLDWDPTTPFELSLQGFHPAPLVSLRTLKADVVTGLSPGQAEKMTKLDEDWMVSGRWGVIQFCDT